MSDASNPSKPAKPFNWDKFQSSLGYTDEQMAEFRADEPAPGLDRGDVLANAPAKRNNLILVPKILE